MGQIDNHWLGMSEPFSLKMTYLKNTFPEDNYNMSNILALGPTGFRADFVFIYSNGEKNWPLNRGQISIFAEIMLHAYIVTSKVNTNLKINLLLLLLFILVAMASCFFKEVS